LGEGSAQRIVIAPLGDVPFAKYFAQGSLKALPNGHFVLFDLWKSYQKGKASIEFDSSGKIIRFSETGPFNGELSEEFVSVSSELFRCIRDKVHPRYNPESFLKSSESWLQTVTAAITDDGEKIEKIRGSLEACSNYKIDRGHNWRKHTRRFQLHGAYGVDTYASIPAPLTIDFFVRPRTFCKGFEVSADAGVLLGAGAGMLGMKCISQNGLSAKYVGAKMSVGFFSGALLNGGVVEVKMGRARPVQFFEYPAPDTLSKLALGAPWQFLFKKCSGCSHQKELYSVGIGGGFTYDGGVAVRMRKSDDFSLLLNALTHEAIVTQP
jgi:hypothetical protein